MGNLLRTGKNTFVDKTTGATIIYNSNDDKMKLYAVAAKGGHCGKGFFMPVIIPVRAVNKEMAIEMVRDMPRIKFKNDDGQNSIMGIMDISKEQFSALKCIKNKDSYFHSNNDRPLNQEVILRRRVAMPQAINDRSTQVKLAEDYLNNLVLQKELAPRMIGGKVVFPSKFNLKKVLNDFIRESLLHLIIHCHYIEAMIAYYDMFGPNNDLQIDANNSIIYFKHNNKTICLPLSKQQEESIMMAKNKFEAKKTEELIQSEQCPATITSARDKFNKRFEKYKKFSTDNVK